MRLLTAATGTKCRKCKALKAPEAPKGLICDVESSYFFKINCVLEVLSEEQLLDAYLDEYNNQCSNQNKK